MLRRTWASLGRRVQKSFCRKSSTFWSKEVLFSSSSCSLAMVNWHAAHLQHWRQHGIHTEMRLCGKSALERVAPGTKGEFGGGRVGGGNDLWRDENRETHGIQGE